jgi:hypothetical protein
MFGGQVGFQHFSRTASSPRGQVVDGRDRDVVIIVVDDRST